MATDPPSVPATSVPGRIRPAGWAPGTSTLLGAWAASAAIARLTGATAVILLLAATLVGFAFEIVAGWWAARSLDVGNVVAPAVVTVGDSCRIRIALDARPRSLERRRLGLGLPDGTDVAVEPEATMVGEPKASTVGEPDTSTEVGPTTIRARFESPGVIRRLAVRVEVSGPAGLIWWRRTAMIAVEPIHVAPVAQGPLLPVESTASTAEGSSDSLRGNHAGEIDGVRPWRHGDSTNAVHWPSSLRADELIVHDRRTATDRRWIVDLSRSDADRLRWTIDEARRRGHPVAIRTDDGALHAVTDADDAARWSAVCAEARADHVDDGHDAPGNGRRRAGILHRELRLRVPSIESATAISAVPRWAAAAAAAASMAMLVGALDASTSMLALVLSCVAVGAGTSLWLARRSGKRPLGLQIAIVSAVLLAIVAIAAQAVEVDGLLAALRGPLPGALMLLVVLHGFEAVDRRTVRVHLAITFVLASYAAGLRIDASLGWWLAAWGAPFAIGLLTTSRRPRRRSPIDRSPRAAVGGAGAVVGLAAATLAVLSLVPIPDGPARLGLPALSSGPTVGTPGGLARPDGTSGGATGTDTPDRGGNGEVVGYPGFTETLDTSLRGELGDDIVMRVRAPEPAFWRGQTFTEFDGRTWRVSPELGRPRTGPVVDVPPTIGDALARSVPDRELIQTYFIEQDLPNLVFAAYRADQVVFDGTLWTRPDGALRSDVTLGAGSVYTVVSQRPQVDAEILRAQGDLGTFFAAFRDAAGGDELDPFLELPASTTRRTIELATALRTPGESTYDTIRAYEAWLGTNTEYDLDAPVPADGADAVDDFLFESQRGYCEQIASALTIMLRSQGVPARLATGYVPGERDRVSGVWNVRRRDAHAWVEVWFPQTGWQAFDPTADVPLAADAGGGTVGGDLVGAAVSSLAAHPVEAVVVTLAALTAVGLGRLLVLARHRRRRGRWGLLQDRFTRLTTPSVLPGPVPTRTDTDGTGGGAATAVPTNAQRASTLADRDGRAAARAVADELDRAAFDPTWVDDDERFERTRSAIATLERSRR